MLTFISIFLSSGNVKNDATDPELKREDYEFSGELFNALHTIFGIKKFRPNQLVSFFKTLFI